MTTGSSSLAELHWCGGTWTAHHNQSHSCPPPVSVCLQTVCLLLILSHCPSSVPGLAPVSQESEGGPEALACLFLSLSALFLSAALTGHPQDLSLKESPTYAIRASPCRPDADLAGQRRGRTRQVQLTAVLSGSSAHCEGMMGIFQKHWCMNITKDTL